MRVDELVAALSNYAISSNSDSEFVFHEIKPEALLFFGAKIFWVSIFP
jgi:hypothetical protein